ncbi:pentatricopeptide repeat-containing protein At2g33680 isoform X1 [Selaginella moellendorffii]|uniref:pentatricopeptide repeat-containing protein At2g33680 isoform X1 n=2 Tax=Selaginella moellendorffii TaxID=88036 RepID=UPI000D1C9374|nr:pentatricopeptide repeat-containing protein At2g33680 isoform X1 [Selaginella moellendorffii]|eukprot:XP_024541626.1 pentatricopeptide repeat-containing protein At2g33680 isoform X1 [Selaginella moellendorffii]
MIVSPPATTKVSTRPSSFRGVDDVDSTEFAALLRQYGISRSVEDGRRLHSQLSGTGRDRETFLGNLIVQMYGRWGCLEDARAAFDRIPRPNVFSWTLLIAAYVDNGNGREALRVFWKMQLEGVEADSFVFSSVLGACSILGCLELGKRLHKRLVDIGLSTHLVLQNSLLNMYTKSGSLEDAARLFREMSQPNIVSWNTMIAANAQHGHDREALEIFWTIDLEGMEPDVFTFGAGLAACSSLALIEQGKAIDERTTSLGFEASGSAALQNALINMYAKCGNLGEARRKFRKIKDKDVVAWNIMIAANAGLGCGEEALNLYREMEVEGLEPDMFTLSSAAVSSSDLQQGRSVHERVLTIRPEPEGSVVVQNALVNMYARCGSVEDAKRVFMDSPDTEKDWNGFISACSQHGFPVEALTAFWEMDLEGVKPVEISTLTSVLAACSLLKKLSVGRALHARIEHGGGGSSSVASTALVEMYANCGSLDEAVEVFDKMVDHRKDLVAWTAMIDAYVRHGCGHDALELYTKMNLEGVRADEICLASVLAACSATGDERTGRRLHSHVVLDRELSASIEVTNALLEMYASFGDLEEAERVFDKVAGRRNVVTWNIMIAALVRDGQDPRALSFYLDMQREGRVRADAFVFASSITACANLQTLEKGEMIHRRIVSSGLERDRPVENAVLNLYVKCGKLQVAEEFFHNMQYRDVVSWNAMITAHAQLGFAASRHKNGASKAMELWNEMHLDGIQPDSISFTVILTLCSHVGLVDQARLYFVWMLQELDGRSVGREEHYGCIVDVLGRLGWLSEAEELIHTMPVTPSQVAWISMLSACRIHPDAARGKWAAQEATKLVPCKSSPYILVHDIVTMAH